MSNDTSVLMDKLTRLSSLLHRYQVSRFRSLGPFANPHRGQGRVLSILRFQPQISQKELGYLLDIRNQSLGELLSKLEKRGYITRTPSEEDRRTAIVTLTDAGRDATGDDTADELDGATVFSDLNNDQRSELGKYLDSINAALGDQLERRGPRRGSVAAKTTNG